MAINKNKVMDAARKARDKGQIDKAIKEYLKIVREDPKDVRVWLKIGDLYAKKNAKAEATETYLRVAKFYSEQGFYLKAVAVYKQILKLDPRLVEVNLKLAELYRQLGLLSDAMQHFEMVAAFFHREGKTREALATIRQLVDLDPENVATRIKLAELYSKEGMVEDAVTEFGHACDYLRKHNRIDDFVKVAERLLWHKPENVPLNRELAGLYLRRGDPRRALQKLQTCFKADQRDVETLGLLAQAFQALDQKGKTVSVLKEMARVLVEVGKRREAEEVHRRILGLAPSDPDSRAFLGEAGQARRGGSPEPVANQVLESPPLRPPRGGLNPTGSLPLVMQSQDLDAVLQMDASGADDEYGLELGEQPSVSHGPVLGEGESDLIAQLSLEAENYELESSVSGEAHAEEIVKILTETDVYVKYGLHQKAIDHLGKVFLLDPQNYEARERLKDILLLQGRLEEAITELCRLAEHFGAQDPDRAEHYLREVIRLDDNNGRALELAERYRVDLSTSENLEIVEGPGHMAAMSGSIGDGSGLLPEPSSPRATGSGAKTALAPPPQPEHVPHDADDELDFDDLDLDSDEAPLAAAPPAGMRGGGSSYAQFEDRGAAAERSPSQSDQFEFELGEDDEQQLGGDELMPEFELGEGDAAGVAPGAGPHGATVEVAMDQVEEAVSVVDLHSDDLDFDAAPAGSDHLPFDPDDAAMFDAEPGFDEGGSLPHAFEGAASTPDTADDVPGVIAALAAEAEASEDDQDGPDTLDPLAPPEPEPYEFGLETGPMGTPPSSSTVEEPAVASRTIQTPFHQVHGHPGEARAAGKSAPSPGGGGTSLEDDLDEADFFVGQGLWEEARDILRSLLHRFPNHPLAMAKLRDVESMVAGADADPSRRQGMRAARVGQESHPDTAGGEISVSRQVAVPVRPARPVVLLENPVEDSDADTHFDLGLAYKEMGLHDEAIKAFQKVLTSSRREVQSHMMIGLCHREQGNLSEAINQFKAGLYVDKITTAEKFGLYYEIGSCYEDLEDPQEALYYYEMVLKKERGYRDVVDRVATIRAMLGASEPASPSRKRPSTLDSETDAALDHLKR